MREKRLRLIVTFSSTTAAMAAEKHCIEAGVPGRLIPVPTQITAGCGLAWCTEIVQREEVLKVMHEISVKPEGIYEMTA